ncbi:MAG: HAD superfamily hydrolase (TIGR01459 family) [Lentimonas sp.]|jgi:HAD superfamily hydrolase (TIGR01459 family)
MIFHKDISPIINNYNYFILDIWGVLHDGTFVYDKVLERLEQLKKQNKKVCLLSNAPRRAIIVERLLTKLGITKDFYDFLLTSGEASYSYLGNYPFGKGEYYYIGPEKDADLLNGLEYSRTSDASQAKFALVTGFDDGNYEISSKLPQLESAVKNNLTLICANPDLTVVRKSGEELLCAGILAKKYEELGGKVIYVGKPYELVYSKVFDLFSNKDKTKILAVGDGILTDILGANQNQIDNAFIAGGIFANELKIKHGQLPDKELMRKITTKYQTKPTFIIGNL